MLPIRAGSEQPNDFAAFCREHRFIRLICFNGAKAAAVYRDKVLGERPREFEDIKSAVLPSTSAAHAAMSYKKKLKRWSIVWEECET